MVLILEVDVLGLGLLKSNRYHHQRFAWVHDWQERRNVILFHFGRQADTPKE